jgi:hypothetical protein
MNLIVVQERYIFQLESGNYVMISLSGEGPPFIEFFVLKVQTLRTYVDNIVWNCTLNFLSASWIQSHFLKKMIKRVRIFMIRFSFCKSTWQQLYIHINLSKKKTMHSHTRLLISKLLCFLNNKC